MQPKCLTSYQQSPVLAPNKAPSTRLSTAEGMSPPNIHLAKSPWPWLNSPFAAWASALGSEGLPLYRKLNCVSRHIDSVHIIHTHIYIYACKFLYLDIYIYILFFGSSSRSSQSNCPLISFEAWLVPLAKLAPLVLEVALETLRAKKMRTLESARKQLAVSMLSCRRTRILRETQLNRIPLVALRWESISL